MRARTHVKSMANTKPATLCRACNERPANSPDYPGVCRWESCEKVGFAQATDRKLADLHEQAERTERDMGLAIETIHYQVGDEREPSHRWGIPGPWKLDLLTCLSKPVAAGYSYHAESLEKAHASLLDCRTRLVGLNNAIDELEAVYALPENRWARFFLVVSSVGHIHSKRSCSSCTWKTRWAWLPDLSGLDEAAAVKAHGAKLCTHCYPSAPVEWTNFFEQKKADHCAGSGKRPTREKWNQCPECGKYGRPTRNGYVKAHKAVPA